MKWERLLQLLMEKWEITRWEGFSPGDGVQDIHIRIERRTPVYAVHHGHGKFLCDAGYGHVCGVDE